MTSIITKSWQVLDDDAGFYNQYYGLKSTEFFRPLSSLNDIHRQIKKVMLLPIIALSSLLKNLNKLLTDVLIIGAGILSLSPSLLRQGLRDAKTDILTVILFPLFVCKLAFEALVSTFTNIFASISCCGRPRVMRNDEELYHGYLVDSKSDRLCDGADKFFNATLKTYSLEKLSPATPFNSLDDVQKHIKTILILPIIAVKTILHNLSKILEGLLIMGVAIPSLSPALFYTGLKDVVAHTMKGVVYPLVLCGYEFGFLLSTLTRPCASLCLGISSSSSYDSDLDDEADYTIRI